MRIEEIVDLEKYPVDDVTFRAQCRELLESTGCLRLSGFLTSAATNMVCKEGDEKQERAYFCTQEHNVYLTPVDENFPKDHVRNLNVVSSKGCITDDQVSDRNPLRTLYNAEVFRSFVCSVLQENELHEYADPLSSINIHYANKGQELGWHFDNSSFAITLMIRPPESGGCFEYVRGVRNSASGDMNFAGVAEVLDDIKRPSSIDLEAGTLLLFRGRDAIHRVTPVDGEVVRMLAVLAYNSEPGIALSESARMTFYGRLG